MIFHGLPCRAAPETVAALSGRNGETIVFIRGDIKCTLTGKEAFAFCSNLETVTLPDSVINIGDDIVWEGSYWYSGGHVYYATIYASPNSAAITYARKNNIGYACDLSQASVTGVKATYAYTGKALKPVPTITLGKQKLIEGQDYKVTYSNNKKVGTATVTIAGQNNYFGTITFDFQITSSSNNKDDKPQTTVVKSFSDSYNVYTVNKNGTSVTLKRSKSKAITTAAIPSSVKANGRTYKVTAIASGAFKNCRKLRQVTIARNISSYGTGGKLLGLNADRRRKRQTVINFPLTEEKPILKA